MTDLLRGSGSGDARVPAPVDGCSPYGDDLQLALYVLYELHYQGFQDVPDSLEWDSGLLACRAALEDRFLGALREDLPVDATETAAQALDDSSSNRSATTAPASRTSSATKALSNTCAHTRRSARSTTSRKRTRTPGSFPGSTAGPRRPWSPSSSTSSAPAAPTSPCPVCSPTSWRIWGWTPRYGRYADAAPAEALATVNLMSLFGLHRALRAALVGHFAAVEVTSSPGSRRLAEAMRRVGAGPAAVRFYTEHVTADAVHEQVVRHDVVGGLLEDEPHLDADVVFGVHATTYLETRLSDRLLGAWRTGATGLREDTWLPVSAGRGKAGSAAAVRVSLVAVYCRGR